MEKKYLLFCLSLLVFFGHTFAQNFTPYPPITVEQSGSPIAFPFAGGMNYPMFSEIDLDNDGKKDLFLWDESGSVVSTFLNTGTAGQTAYAFAPQYAAAFPPLHAWVLLRDYNCDGKPDIFTTGAFPNKVYVYENTSPAVGLSFAASPVGPLLADNDTIYVADTDIPSIDDIDNDGDLDILSYDTQGFYVKWYENRSQDNHQNCNFLEFTLNTHCWGHFKEDGLNNTVTLNEVCPSVIVGDSTPSTRHAGSTLLTIDTDGDGVREVLLGDISFDNVVYLHNGGTANSANMDAYVYKFPDYDIPVQLTIFPGMYGIDVNNDSKKDLVFSPSSPTISSNFKNIHLYLNNGTGSQSTFYKMQDDFLQEDMIDCGAVSSPVFVDLNADGLLDMVVGNELYQSGSTQYSDLTAYLNIGTATQPAFRLHSRELLDTKTVFKTLPIKAIHPTFGDMDADGDLDLVIGDYAGNLHWFENTAAAGAFAKYELKQQNYATIDVGAASTPCLFDVNLDGKLDLVVGEQMGNLNYFENKGTVQQPAFSPSPDNALFGGIDVSPVCCSGYSVPFLFYQGGQQIQLLVGTEYGEVWHYDNISGNLGGTFNLQTQQFGGLKHAGRCFMSGADIDQDTQLEWVAGNHRGGLQLFKSNIAVGNLADCPPATFKVYPNPTQGSFRLETTYSGEKQLEIWDSYGQLCYSAALSGSAENLDISRLPVGMYFVVLVYEGRREIVKVGKD